MAYIAHATTTGDALRRYDVVEALGLSVATVATLKANVVLVEGYDVALVRPDLTDEEHEKVLDWLLYRAITKDLAQCPSQSQHPPA